MRYDDDAVQFSVTPAVETAKQTLIAIKILIEKLSTTLADLYQHIKVRRTLSHHTLEISRIALLRDLAAQMSDTLHQLITEIKTCARSENNTSFQSILKPAVGKIQMINTVQTMIEIKNNVDQLQNELIKLNTSHMAITKLRELTKKINSAIIEIETETLSRLHISKQPIHPQITLLTTLKNALLAKKIQYEKRYDKTGIKKLVECSALITYVDNIQDALIHHRSINTVDMALPTIHWTPLSELAKIRKAIKNIRDTTQAKEFFEKHAAIKTAALQLKESKNTPQTQVIKELSMIIAELDLKEAIYSGRKTTHKIFYYGFFSKNKTGAKSAHEKLTATLAMKCYAERILAYMKIKERNASATPEINMSLPQSPASKDGTLSKIRNRLEIIGKHISQTHETFHLF